MILKLLLLCTVNTYHIGNSLTFDSLGNSESNIQNGPYGIERIADYYGVDLNMSMHVDSSQGLKSIWDNPLGVGGIVDAQRSPYNDFTNAFSNFTWDKVVLEPYRKPGETLGTDKEMIANFMGLSPNSTFYIYQVWPPQSFGNYDDYWLSNWEYTDNVVTRPMRSYYQALMPYLNQNQVVREIPTGEILFNIHESIESGYITEFSFSDLYRDDLHASGNLGRYIAATTVFSTMLKMDVTNLLPPETFSPGLVAPSAYEKINQIIWDTVSLNRYSGISDINDDNFVDTADLNLILDGYGTEYDGRDILLWQRNFNPAPTLQALQVPEPSSIALFIVCSVLCTLIGYVAGRSSR